MKCPACSIEGRIKTNNLVKKQDGTFAYKMEIMCRNKQCSQYGKVFSTIYHPVTVAEDE